MNTNEHQGAINLSRRRELVEDAARALDEIEQCDDDLKHARGGCALHKAFARIERTVLKLQVADLGADEARELGTLVLEVVRVTIRAQCEAWKMMKKEQGEENQLGLAATGETVRSISSTAL